MPGPDPPGWLSGRQVKIPVALMAPAPAPKIRWTIHSPTRTIFCPEKSLSETDPVDTQVNCSDLAELAKHFVFWKREEVGPLGRSLCARCSSTLFPSCDLGEMGKAANLRENWEMLRSSELWLHRLRDSKAKMTRTKAVGFFLSC